MKQQFEAWEASDGLVFASSDSIAEHRAKGLLRADAKFLYSIEAVTWEEASAVHYLRMGFGPYKPVGKPEPCPKCDALYYPKGSGQCWRCGLIS